MEVRTISDVFSDPDKFRAAALAQNFDSYWEHASSSYSPQPWGGTWAGLRSKPLIELFNAQHNKELTDSIIAYIDPPVCSGYTVESYLQFNSAFDPETPETNGVHQISTEADYVAVINLTPDSITPRAETHFYDPSSSFSKHRPFSTEDNFTHRETVTHAYNSLTVFDPAEFIKESRSIGETVEGSVLSLVFLLKTHNSTSMPSGFKKLT